MNESNPWKTLESSVVYENPWISVRNDAVVRPDGKPGVYGVVHYKNTAVGVLPIDDEGFVYLVGQYRYPLGKYSWEIPEGGCVAGEDLLEAAKRELEEETGMTAGEWKHSGTAYLSNSTTDEVAHWYLATNLRKGQPKPEGTEQLRYKKVSLVEIIDMVAQGEIDDALSILAINSYVVWKVRHKLELSSVVETHSTKGHKR